MSTEHILPMLVAPEWGLHRGGGTEAGESSPRPCVAFMFSPDKMTLTPVGSDLHNLGSLNGFAGAGGLDKGSGMVSKYTWLSSREHRPGSRRVKAQPRSLPT